VEQLMRELGLRGAVRGKTPCTTMGAKGVARPADLVDRNFVAAVPNRLWVAHLISGKTHSGWVFVASIVGGYSRDVVGWQASRSLRASRKAGLGVPEVAGQVDDRSCLDRDGPSGSTGGPDSDLSRQARALQPARVFHS
jgi:transposase InsO family protein